MRQIIHIDLDLKDLIPGYLKSRENDLRLLRDALSVGDFKLIEVVAHKIKGSAGGYGFELLGAIGDQLESTAKSKEKSEIENLLQSMQQYLEKIDVRYR